MHIFEDQSRSYPIHYIDPRVRIIGGFGLSIFMALSKSWGVIAIELVAAFLLLSLAGMFDLRTFKKLGSLNFFMLVILVILPFSISPQAEVNWLGRQGIQIGPVFWSYAGFLRSLMIVMRANAILVTFLACVGSMEPIRLGAALNRLMLPEKLSQIFVFMVRYIEVFHHEYHRLNYAMKLRAFSPKFNLHTFRSYGFLVGQLILQSMERSEKILEAMKCRGFAGRFYSLAQFRIRLLDVGFLMSVTFLLVVLGIMEAGVHIW